MEALWATCLLLLGLLFTLWVGRRSQVPRQSMLAFMLFLLLATIYHVLTRGLNGDEITYQTEAGKVAIALSNASPWQSSLPLEKQSLSFVLGAIYVVTGVSWIVGLVALAPCMGVLPGLMAACCRNFGLSRYANTAAWLIACIPQVLIWSPWLRREAVSFALLTFALLGVSLLYAGSTALGTALVSLSLLALAFTRIQLIWTVLAASAVALTVAHLEARRESVSSSWRSALSFAVILSVGASALLLMRGTTVAVLDEDARTDIVAANSAQEHNLAARYDFTARTEESQSGQQLQFAWLVNAIDSAIGPFPWTWKNAVWAVAGLDGALFFVIWLVALSVTVMRKEFRPVIWVLLVGAMPLLLGNAVMFANFGIAMRVRAHLIPLLVPFIAIAFVDAYDRVNQGRARRADAP